MKKKVFIILTSIVIVLITIILVVFKGSIFSNVTDKAKDGYVYVYDNENLLQLADSLEQQGLIKSADGLLKTARIMGFSDKHLIPGRYQVKPGWNNVQLLDFLSRGKQSPVNLVVNPVRKVENLASVVGKRLEYDSLDFVVALTDTLLLDSLGVNKYNAMTLFIPNTYQVYWTIKPKSFLHKMKKEADLFWESDGRLNKLKELGMTKEEVYTLASIVDKETLADAEKPTVAGLYLNRLKMGMPLQADPTVVFANNDFTIKRVTNKHTAIKSPYNTYLNKGLPPGPISMATASGIDAVLNHEKHNYLYMCARPDTSGRHNFAETFEAHVQFANIYRDWLTKQGLSL